MRNNGLLRAVLNSNIPSETAGYPSWGSLRRGASGGSNAAETQAPARVARAAQGLLAGIMLLGSVANSTGDSIVDDCEAEEFEIAFEQALAGGGTITLLCPGTNRLTSTKMILVDTTIQGTTTTGWLVGSGSNRLFQVAAGVELRLINLRLAGGRALGAAGADGTEENDGAAGEDAIGGAILNEGGVIRGEGVVFRDHHALGGNGGAGYSVTEIGLTTTPGGRGGHGRGGAIANLGGLVEFIDCRFETNRAAGGIGGDGGSSGTFLRDGGTGGAGGEGCGGAIYNASNGIARLVRCEFRLNHADGAEGGAGGQGAGLLYFDGANGSSAAGRGGAVAQTSGDLHLDACVLSRNSVKGAAGLAAGLNANTRTEAAGGSGLPGQGGGLYAGQGRLRIAACSFADNIAQGGGGGEGGLSGSGGNGGDGGSGAPGQGGAAYFGSEAEVDLVDSTFSYNAAFGAAGGFGSLGAGPLASVGTDGSAGSGEGGAAWFTGQKLNVSRCLFEYNRTQGAEGLAGAPGSASEPGATGNRGGAGLGGALFGGSGILAITNVTFHTNETFGGKGGKGGDGSPSGLFATDGGDGGTGGTALGAALWCQSVLAAEVVQCTFATNRVVAGEGGIGGAAGDPDLARPGRDGTAGAAAGASVGASDTMMVLRYTLLAHGVGGTEATGAIQDGGCNLSTDPTPPFETSLNGVDPLLGSLADRGGPTRTISLEPGSPAIDMTGCASAAPIDQRGLVRDAQPDAGAFEAGAGMPAPAIISNGGMNVQVSWPDYGVVYTLQTSSSFPPAWTTIDGAVPEDGSWVYRPEAVSSQGYYRLSR
jgi:hypothetical protein